VRRVTNRPQALFFRLSVPSRCRIAAGAITATHPKANPKTL
jgi:hypothetical protein